LPITTGTIDLDALQRDRDQLWAEAAAAEARGEQLTIDAHLYAVAAEQQDQRLIKDVWEDLLANIQRGAVGPDGVERVSTETLLRIELGLTPDKINDGTTKRLRHAMQRLGWSGPKKMRFDEPDHPGCEKRSTPKQGYWRKSTKM
jgi:putative DNA primase/helicase